MEMEFNKMLNVHVVHVDKLGCSLSIHAAVCLQDSIIQPLPKGAKDLAKSSNYHGIALASCLGKLLELCVLQLFPKFFNTLRL